MVGGFALGRSREKDRTALLDVEIHERGKTATARAAAMVEGNRLALAVAKLAVAVVCRRWPVLLADRLVTLADELLTHRLEPRRAASDFAAVLEFVAFAD